MSSVSIHQHPAIQPVTPRQTGNASGSLQKETPMRAEIPNQSLCSNCAHAADCTFCASAGQVVFHCDMHETHSREDALTAREKKDDFPHVKPVDEAGTHAYGGLCVNCAERRDCALPRPEGGVWHCEEYR